MNVLIPMAGRGSRFVEAGVATPKPLIDVFGSPMYSWAVDGLSLDDDCRLVFLCLQEHLVAQSLEADIRRRYARYRPEIICVNAVTAGQACTVLLAKHLIDNATPLLIYNADTYYRSDLLAAIRAADRPIDGAVDVFRADGERWSFVREDHKHRAIEFAEKKRISDLASTGLYYFQRGADFVRQAEAMISAHERVNNEYYVAPVYNRMITAGASILVHEATNVWVLGTPEDLGHFQQKYRS